MRTSIRNALAASVFAALAAAPVFAADAAAKPLDLAQAMDLVGKTYPGRVISGQTDAIGGDGAHHHVDVLLVNGRVVKFDVDAATHRIYNRLPPDEAPATVSLMDAIRDVEAKNHGKVMSAEYDPDPAPHYHMTLRTPQGKLARLDVDVNTGETRTRKPRS